MKCCNMAIGDRVIIHDPLLTYGKSPWLNRTGVIKEELGYAAMVKLDNDKNRTPVIFFNSEYQFDTKATGC